MSDLLIGILGALLATNPPAAVSNLVHKQAGVSIPFSNPNDPVEMEYLKLLERDNATQAEVDEWIRDNQAFAEKGAGITPATLGLRIKQHLRPVRDAYEDFLRRHPEHTRARLAYGSFLNDLGEEDEAAQQWEKARELEPGNPAAWNNLANYYGHRSPVKKAFDCYAKAIELAPDEPVYYQNLATTVFMFRKDAMEHYQIDEQKVFDRALELYHKALALDPSNFIAASELAQTYYGIRPPRYDEALAAWQAARNLARDDIEREGVFIHLARWQIDAGRFADARNQLNAVTNAMYGSLKTRLTKKLADKQIEARDKEAKERNALSAPPTGGK